MSFVDNLVPTTKPDCTIDYHREMDRSATVNHDHLKQYMVNFNPIDQDYIEILRNGATRGPWVTHLWKRSKVTVEPFIENPRGIICTTNWNSLNNLDRGPPRDDSCEVRSKSNKWFQRRCCLKKLLTHSRWTMGHHKSSP